MTCAVFLLAATAFLYVLLAVSAKGFRTKTIKEGPQVKLVIVVTRHGDRTPLFSFKPENLEPVTWNCELPATIEAVPIQIFDTASPPFPRLYRKIYKKDIESFAGNCAAGQLTVTGMRQHYALGERLRRKYSTLLQNVKLEFDSKEVYVESSDIPRTFLSAQSQLLAVFPPKQSTTMNTGDVIPIVTTELSVSDFFPNYATCPKLANVRDAILKSQAFKDFEKKITPFKNELAKKLKFMNGTSVGFPSWTQMYDTFACRRAHDFPLPAGFTNAIIDEIIKVAEAEYQFLLNDKQYVKLGIGPFLARLKEKMSDKITGRDNDLKYALFSGHDTTVAPLLGLFGIFDGFWPPYAANIVFEVLEDESATERWSVRLLYNDRELTVPGCPPKQPCPWRIFDAVTKALQVDPMDYAKLCAV